MKRLARGIHNTPGQLGLLLLCLLVISALTLSQTHPVRASGHGIDSWLINANGPSNELDFFDQVQPSTLDGSSLHDVYYGTLFDEGVMGYKVLQADGSMKVSFVRLESRSSSFADSFQIYTGIQSADRTSLSGTFRVYTGSIVTIAHYAHGILTFSSHYVYTRDPQIYSWGSTPSSNSSEYHNILNSGDVQPLNITINGFLGTMIDLGPWSASAGYPNRGLIYSNGFSGGAIGYLPSTVYCPPVEIVCQTYFVRATSLDFSTFQVYQGTFIPSSLGIAAQGTFVEISQGQSGNDSPWSMSYLNP